MAVVKRLDWLLLLMTLIWGTNYALVKSAFREIDPQAFNALRLIEASILMVGANILVRRMRPADGDAPGAADVASIFHTPAPVTRDDWIRIAWLGLIGHCVYQFLFVGGLAKTSVANSSLLLATSPVAITLLSTIGGRERTGALHWAGLLLSLFGVYLVVGRGAHATSASLAGDMMMIGSVLCWALYTIGARPLMARHSPVGVTALSMLIGTVLYVPLAAASLARVDWSAVSAATWAKLVYSSAFAICVAYTIWYAAVREIGSARTAVYSNLLPIIAMLTAYFWLHEPLGRAKMAGAAAILAGVALTRMGQARLQIPQ
jgi:drug/metabolite transporter (DMT)-like permease